MTRMVTLKTPASPGAYSVFGGVIFCRADRTDIQTLKDLGGKTFMAVNPQSLGGWRMAWRELVAAGIDHHRDFKELRFGGFHDFVGHRRPNRRGKTPAQCEPTPWSACRCRAGSR